MTLKLKIAPKNRYWTEVIVICPQDFGETVESRFEVQWERFTHSELKQFQREQTAISQHAALGVVRRLKSKNNDVQEAAEVMEAAYADALGELPEEFDPGTDFALRWLRKKMTGIRLLLTEDDQEVTLDDLPDLVEIISYRAGLMSLLRAQLEDPNAAERKN